MLSLFFPNYDNRMVLCLAGIWQATATANQLASAGEYDQAAFTRCLKALLNIDPQSDMDIFGEESEMQTGLKSLAEFCDKGRAQDYATRYALQVMQLQKRFLNNPNAQLKVRDGIDHTSRQAEMYGFEDDNLIHSLGRLYQDNLSPLMPIQVMGKHQFLQQDLNAARVRTLLFSAVRFCHLWRQSGGRTTDLFFGRSKISALIDELLK